MDSEPLPALSYAGKNQAKTRNTNPGVRPALYSPLTKVLARLRSGEQRGGIGRSQECTRIGVVESEDPFPALSYAEIWILQVLIVSLDSLAFFSTGD